VPFGGLQRSVHVVRGPLLPFGQTVTLSAAVGHAEATGARASAIAATARARIHPRLHSRRLRALVLLHGLGSGPSGWQPQLQAFPNASAPRLERAEETMDRLEPPFDVCGLSLGALRALRYAGEHPERIHRLVVCAGFARLPAHFRLLQRGMAVVVGAVPSSRVGKGLVSGLPEEHRPAALEEVDATHVGRTMREAAVFRLERPPRMPTLVLCGERDRVNLKLSRQLAALLPDARFEVVPAAGHVANLDNPKAFNRLLRDFLA
jgi:3-oxoadipate enol-lactonase